MKYRNTIEMMIVMAVAVVASHNSYLCWLDRPMISKENSFRSEAIPFLSDNRGESHTAQGQQALADSSSSSEVLSRTLDGTKKSHLLYHNYILFAVILSIHQGSITTCLSYADTQLSIHLGRYKSMSPCFNRWSAMLVITWYQTMGS